MATGYIHVPTSSSSSSSADLDKCQVYGIASSTNAVAQVLSIPESTRVMIKLFDYSASYSCIIYAARTTGACNIAIASTAPVDLTIRTVEIYSPSYSQGGVQVQYPSARALRAVVYQYGTGDRVTVV